MRIEDVITQGWKGEEKLWKVVLVGAALALLPQFLPAVLFTPILFLKIYNLIYLVAFLPLFYVLCWWLLAIWSCSRKVNNKLIRVLTLGGAITFAFWQIRQVTEATNWYYHLLRFYSGSLD